MALSRTDVSGIAEDEQGRDGTQDVVQTVQALEVTAAAAAAAAGLRLRLGALALSHVVQPRRSCALRSLRRAARCSAFAAESVRAVAFRGIEIVFCGACTLIATKVELEIQIALHLHARACGVLSILFCTHFIHEQGSSKCLKKSKSEWEGNCTSGGTSIQTARVLYSSGGSDKAPMSATWLPPNQCLRQPQTRETTLTAPVLTTLAEPTPLSRRFVTWWRREEAHQQARTA